MKQEMRKLNRAKYARSEEEVKRLTAEGYVPVGKKAVLGQQNAGPEQSAAATGQMDGQPVKQPAAGKKNKKPKNPTAAADQKGNGTEQSAAVPDPAVADGGDTGND